MTLQQYITKREKEFSEIFGELYHACVETNWKGVRATDEVKSFHRQTIKEVVEKVLESVPVKRRTPTIKPDPYRSMGGLMIDTTDFQRDVGHNQHVQEVKRWKKKLLKELK